MQIVFNFYDCYLDAFSSEFSNTNIDECSFKLKKIIIKNTRLEECVKEQKRTNHRFE